MVPQSDLTMADVKKAKREPRGRYCVAVLHIQQSCRNTSFTPGVRMYQFASDPAVRAKWVQFVRRHRHDFKEINYEQKFIVLRGTWMNQSKNCKKV